MLRTRLPPIYLVAGVMLVPLLAGCGSSSKSSSGTTTGPTSSAPTTAPKGLKPSESVEAERQAANAQIVTFGQPGKLPDDVYVIFNTPLTVGGDDLGPWLVTPVRVENRGSADQSMPNIGIVCMGSTEMGGYQAGSTAKLTDTLPTGSYRQGTLNLLLPHDSRTGTPVPSCGTPAYVQAIPLVTDTSTKPVRVQIPDATVASLNAKRHA
jgi:hypothetical protein